MMRVHWNRFQRAPWHIGGNAFPGAINACDRRALGFWYIEVRTPFGTLEAFGRVSPSPEV